jgi:hypothetical protein
MSAGVVNPLPAAMRIADDYAMATTRRADMFTADGKPSDDDPRENGPRLGGERVTLTESLRCAQFPTPRWSRRHGTHGLRRWTSPRGSWLARVSEI